MYTKKILNSIYGIYGASGYGKEIYPLIKDKYENIVFVDDNSDLNTLFGCDILTFENFLDSNYSERYITIAISNGVIRERLTNKCLQNGIKLLNIEALNVTKLENIDIKDGYILNPFVTLTSDIKIGKSFQANLYSYIAHDCVIGDYVTFAPSVKCNGNVIIEDFVYVGTGTIIKQGKANKPLIIGKGATIQAGSFVTKNIPPGMTVFGNPAIELTKENLKRRK